MLEKKRVNTGALLSLFGAVAALALVILLENTIGPTGQLFTVLKKGAVYALVAVSMNLLNGFTGLFSLGQAGFMLLGAYTYAILTVPVAAKDTVYYLYGGSAVKFSLPDLFAGIFGDGMLSLTLGVVQQISPLSPLRCPITQRWLIYVKVAVHTPGTTLIPPLAS